MAHFAVHLVQGLHLHPDGRQSTRQPIFQFVHSVCGDGYLAWRGVDFYRMGAAAWRGSLSGKGADGSEDLTADSSISALVDDYVDRNGWLGAVPRSIDGRRDGLFESHGWLWRYIALHTGVVLQRKGHFGDSAGDFCRCALEGMLSRPVGQVEGFLPVPVGRAGRLGAAAWAVRGIGHDVDLYFIYLLQVLKRK